MTKDEEERNFEVYPECLESKINTRGTSEFFQSPKFNPLPPLLNESDSPISSINSLLTFEPTSSASQHQDDTEGQPSNFTLPLDPLYGAPLPFPVDVIAPINVTHSVVHEVFPTLQWDQDDMKIKEESEAWESYFEEESPLPSPQGYSSKDQKLLAAYRKRPEIEKKKSRKNTKIVDENLQHLQDLEDNVFEEKREEREEEKNKRRKKDKTAKISLPTLYDLDPDPCNGSAHKIAWSLNRYRVWAAAHNNNVPSTNAPLDFLALSPDRYNAVLAVFFAEVRDPTNDFYCYRTLYRLACGLRRVAEETHGPEANFMDPKCRKFTFLYRVLDSVIKDRQSKDRRLTTKSKADVITYEHEHMMWERSFDTRHPRGLLRALVFLMCKTFCLRGSSELVGVCMDRVKIEHVNETEVLLSYFEIGSTNHEGNLNTAPKVVRHIDDKNDPKGLYHNMVLYFKRCPPEVQRGAVTFFQHPLQLPVVSLEILQRRKLWYNSARPLSKTYFAPFMKGSFDMAGVIGDFTLRSIRATVITRLKDAPDNFSDEDIRTRTGHFSDGELSNYHTPSGIDFNLIRRLSNNVARNSTSVLAKPPAPGSSQHQYSAVNRDTQLFYCLRVVPAWTSAGNSERL